MEEIPNYFVHLSYAGTEYNGWQHQPNGCGVQRVLEDKLAVILQCPVAITGCGRTDTGVHASCFYAHFAFAGDLPANLLTRWNSLLPPDIAVHQLYCVPPAAHARFDAIKRGYSYYINPEKSPFRHRLEWYYPPIGSCDFELMQQAAQLLLNYHNFSTFCKSHHDAKTPFCNVQASTWRQERGIYIYQIEADRFLRGMVRMIVGMCIQIGQGKIQLDQVTQAMESNTMLQRAWSVPPDGLYLDEVIYPPYYLETALF